MSSEHTTQVTNDTEVEYAIEVNGLSKCYQIYDKPSDRLKQMLMRGRKQYYKEFWALKDVSFKIKKGETVGIIGRNGSGKSTLLQMICGTLNPTGGEVKVNGRVAALLELGAGFNPEFSGVENVYMAASLYGLSKEEVDQRFDAIATFADIGDHLHQPVKTYSSGMYVRLAFAVIANVGADILVVDEALAVGDIYFQQKCMRYLRKFQDGGGTILFVSHDTGAVMSLCRTALWLRKSQAGVNNLGSAESVCKAYLQDFYAHQDKVLIDEPEEIEPLDKVSTYAWEAEPFPENILQVSTYNHHAESFGVGGGRFISAVFVDPDDQHLTTLQGGQSVVLRLTAKIERSITAPAFGITLKDRLGQFIYSESTDVAFRRSSPVFAPGDIVTVSFCFRMPVLLQGSYTIDIAFAEGIGHEHTQHHWVHDALVLSSLSGRLVQGVVGLPELAVHMSRMPSSDTNCLKGNL